MPQRTSAASPEGRRAVNTRTRHAEVHRLKADKLSNKAIARRLRLDIKTVRRYVRADSLDQLLNPNPSGGRDVLGAFKPFLHHRMQPTGGTGETNPAPAAASPAFRRRRASLLVVRGSAVGPHLEAVTHRWVQGRWPA
ncbi:hypothetical protein [Micromonospora sp. NPDC126480]|uniref:hypothetical protein n=1 Tax=Micromonospora sp. NPDC126480 TaxID=3155312 RepID=UPI0033291CA8